MALFPNAAAHAAAGFVPLSARLQLPAEVQPAEPAAPATVIDPAEIEATAFAAGFDEGLRTAQVELEAERASLAILAESLTVLKPEPSRDLALLLSETVSRLVRQAIGEVAIDETMLLRRAEQVAGLIAEASVPGRMRLHPDDVARLADARLPVELVGDPLLAPGTALLETNDGWIEAGPDVALEKLGAALDRLGAPR
ncbi:hypothetical protein ABC347_11130 [Sphingomonas sp. 1P06PA]|uniref:FliH/SctL family protein n=1 Tax=Sphingomonas sp. 1P06PA TaxID=554121 RepID=UPI0039A6BBB1